MDALLEGAKPDQIAELPLPDSCTAACLHREDEGLFSAHEAEPDITRSIHIEQVPVPTLAPDEVLVAVFASAINYNTVWSAMFRPASTFSFLDHQARTSDWAARHATDRQVIGSDAAGVIVRKGDSVRHWELGDKVVVSAVYTDEQQPEAHWDGMLASNQLAWGFETNFGGLAHYAVVKSTALLPKAPHLSWEEAAANTLCGMTAYRMLVSSRGAAMKQGDIVLIWGASGGLGGYAVQLVKNGGGIAVGVVGSEAKRDLATRLGCDAVINRQELEGGFAGVAAWRELGRQIRGHVGEDPHIVFEHTGQDTFGASVYVARRGGTIITCGSSTGYEHTFDNRFLWMKIKRIIGSHGANYQEASEFNRLVAMGHIVPTLSTVYPLAEAADAARSVQLNQHTGKVGVLCMAPEEQLGIEDRALRDQIGEERLRLFRDFSGS
ncbi:crotonyl-CoA carboxylase/reductase [Catenulispora sp. NF23]|uniref:Crotonyl-CoA carboxylase/reductase n=2 Tax=Catenulispora pinistramenti TaxID=2705254 RepID=A0ABS5KX00_9ACTN|nr:crotonyl-CoA carboxylase/reductase [Catenulispora pinistramenti]MBS2550578.1 crotonyl-CoA carboxylase/reductase [Catenulispora pinistramenti]